MSIDIQQIRSNFPALQSDTIFFDGPGGTQVTQSVIDAIRDYYVTANANHGGAFPTSQRNDQIIHAAREAFADFFNARAPEEIVFGNNMTTLTFHMSRALGRTLQPGDEIMVTRLDHDANISPWLALQERGIVVKWVDIHTDDVTLDMADFEKQLSNKTRVVAVGLASNAVGTVNPVRQIADLAHMAGAFVYIDAVHYAPHFPIDVQALNCDFLVCSAYKFCGPHLGILYGKHELLERLQAYKVRPSPPEPPEKWETGTQNFEGIAGAAAAVNYLAGLGAQYGGEHARDFPGFTRRRLNLKTGMAAIHAYEKELFTHLMVELAKLESVTTYGITDLSRFDRRTPTVAFNLKGHTPQEVARALGEENINVWDGNYYALAVMERLGLQETGGAVRVGLAHYNTRAEVDRLLERLRAIAG
ncbi:MAG: cysteine desulfurase-like protein [Anaerolineae bacterium]